MKILSVTTLSFFLCVSNLLAYTVNLNGPAEIYFSPDGGATSAVVNNINLAQKSIYVQAYVLSSWPIINALIDAKKRNLDVQIILDKGHNTDKYFKYTNALFDVGIPIYIDDKPRIAHNKIMIIDNQLVISGSFNFTMSAEKNNTENLIVCKNDSLAVVYLNNFKSRLSKSFAYIKQ